MERATEMREEEEEDKRREAAIASLQSTFIHKHVSQRQLSKLQELHKRRIQVKSKIHKKAKDRSGKKLHGNDHQNSGDKYSDEHAKDLNLMESCNPSSGISGPQDDVAADVEPKKRHKLHWGLDTKERWERKSNM